MAEDVKVVRTTSWSADHPGAPHGRAYLPFPTELCILCAPRTKKGLEPACVSHCMAGCMRFGPLEELAKELGTKPRLVLWSPR